MNADYPPKEGAQKKDGWHAQLSRLKDDFDITAIGMIARDMDEEVLDLCAEKEYKIMASMAGVAMTAIQLLPYMTMLQKFEDRLPYIGYMANNIHTVREADKKARNLSPANSCW